MKNGRSLRGHRRIITPVGMSKQRNQPPNGGWDATCLCGWKGGNYPNIDSARFSYKQHLDDMIDNHPVKCHRCGDEKLASEMSAYSRYVCKPCSSALGDEWQLNNPEKSADHKRNHAFLRDYGISLATVKQIIGEQEGLCAICGIQLNELGDKRGRAPQVDHDHITGKVRAVLCFACNAGLGSFQDDITRLQSAITYLKRHGK